MIGGSVLVSKNTYNRLRRILWYLVIIGFVIGSVNVLFNKDTYNGKDKEKNFFPGMEMFEYRLVLVLTGSMLPKIQINSISMMKQCNIEDVNLGDIIMYKNPDSGVNITHRVVNVKYDNDGNKYVLTRGDANPVVDGLIITDKELVGKLEYTINGVAPFISIFVNEGNIDYTKFSFVLSVFLVVLFVVYSLIDEGVTILALLFICSISSLYTEYVQSFNDKVCKDIGIQRYLKSIKINKSDNIIQKVMKLYIVYQIGNFRAESVRVSTLMDKKFRKGAGK